jgi:hypothetical protein
MGNAVFCLPAERLIYPFKLRHTFDKLASTRIGKAFCCTRKVKGLIRTHKIPCKLNRAVADALNLASGGIYTGVLVAHWRVVRKKGIWLSEKAGTRLSDSIVEAALHAHTIDAAQQGFYKACRTAQAAKRLDPQARYPHWTKKFRTAI